MSNEQGNQLVSLKDVLQNNQMSKYATPEIFKELATSLSWLPLFRMYTSTAELVKKGTIRPGHYGVSSTSDDVEDLGTEVIILPLSWRPKAIKFGGVDGKSSPITFYNPNLPEFKEIQENSSDFGTGCAVGPEFLLWIPVIKKFATYHMSGAIASRKAPELASMIGKVTLLKTQYLDKLKYPNFCPVVLPCSQEIELPNEAELNEQLGKFNNPEDSTIEFDPKKLEEEQARAR